MWNWIKSVKETLGEPQSIIDCKGEMIVNPLWLKWAFRTSNDTQHYLDRVKGAYDLLRAYKGIKK